MIILRYNFADPLWAVKRATSTKPATCPLLPWCTIPRVVLHISRPLLGRVLHDENSENYTRLFKFATLRLRQRFKFMQKFSFANTNLSVVLLIWINLSKKRAWLWLTQRRYRCDHVLAIRRLFVTLTIRRQPFVIR